MEKKSRYSAMALVAIIGGMILISGCNATNQVVSKGPFQKRKYRHGWSVDIAGKHPNEKHRAASARTEEAARLHLEPVAEEAVMVDEEPVLSASIGTDATAKAISDPGMVQEARSSEIGAGALVSPPQQLDRGRPAKIDRLAVAEKNEAPVARADGDKSAGTNGMAIAGFVCSFFIPILGIVFSAIGLGQCNRRGQKGKGLAIAGLIISILTILIFLALA